MLSDYIANKFKIIFERHFIHLNEEVQHFYIKLCQAKLTDEQMDCVCTFTNTIILALEGDEDIKDQAKSINIKGEEMDSNENVISVVFYNKEHRSINYQEHSLKEVLESRSLFLRMDGEEYCIRYYSDIDKVAFATRKD